MADLTTRTALSVCATTSSRLPDLSIKNGQLIFVQDIRRVAFDFNDKRVFYNQIEELESDAERLTIANPMAGYYFVIDTAILWFYQDKWIQLTTPPEDIVFIGTELPELGKNEKVLYVNKKEKNISVWDNESSKYVIVSDKTKSLSESEIDLLFV